MAEGIAVYRWTRRSTTRDARSRRRGFFLSDVLIVISRSKFPTSEDGGVWTVERDKSQWMDGVCIDDEAIEATDGDGGTVVTDRPTKRPATRRLQQLP